MEKDNGRKNPEWIPVQKLILDDENYRLPGNFKGSNQRELLQILDRDFALSIIGESLADNGYFVEEPLIGIPGPKDKIIIVEGNRRLAALKLIVQAELRKVARDPEYWENLAKRLQHDVSEVPVIIYGSRDELITFLGYRHIAGIVKWDPLSKARFIHNLTEKKGNRAEFSDVARETGSSAATIRANYITYRVFLQAKDDFGIDTSRLEKNFSVFYRAINNVNIAEFLDLKKVGEPSDLKKPISKRKAAALEEVIGYVHGTSEIKPVIFDSRQLTTLGEVLVSKEAYQNLRLNRNLLQADQLSGGEERRLIDSLNKASLALDDSLRDAHRYTKNKRVSLLVLRCAESMEQILISFPDVKKEVEKGVD